MAIHAPDLTKQPPRSPRVRLGGYVILPRILDKGRALLAGTQGENKLLLQQKKKLETELAIYKTPDYKVPLPAALKGKIIVTDPKWNFVVLDTGENQGVLEHGELLVNRNGKLVGKVIVRTVQ